VRLGARLLIRVGVGPCREPGASGAGGGAPCTALSPAARLCPGILGMSVVPQPGVAQSAGPRRAHQRSSPKAAASAAPDARRRCAQALCAGPAAPGGRARGAPPGLQRAWLLVELAGVLGRRLAMACQGCAGAPPPSAAAAAFFAAPKNRRVRAAALGSCPPRRPARAQDCTSRLAGQSAGAGRAPPAASSGGERGPGARAAQACEEWAARARPLLMRGAAAVGHHVAAAAAAMGQLADTRSRLAALLAEQRPATPTPPAGPPPAAPPGPEPARGAPLPRILARRAPDMPDADAAASSAPDGRPQGSGANPNPTPEAASAPERLADDVREALRAAAAALAALGEPDEIEGLRAHAARAFAPLAGLLTGRGPGRDALQASPRRAGWRACACRAALVLLRGCRQSEGCGRVRMSLRAPDALRGRDGARAAPRRSAGAQAWAGSLEWMRGYAAAAAGAHERAAALHTGLLRRAAAAAAPLGAEEAAAVAAAACDAYAAVGDGAALGAWLAELRVRPREAGVRGQAVRGWPAAPAGCACAGVAGKCTRRPEP